MMISNAKVLHASVKTLVFISALTMDEFLSQTSNYGTLIKNRLREIHLTPDDQAFFVDYPDVLHFVALVAEDSPETVAVLPILARIAEVGTRFDLCILRDDDDPTMLNTLVDTLDTLVDDSDPFADPSELDLPMLLIFDEEWQYQDRWGPHPQAAEAHLDDWLERHPEYESLADEESPEAQSLYARLLNTLTYEMRIWYNSELNGECIKEIRKVLVSLQEDNEVDEGAGSEAG
jgi:hypothetical protein